MVNGLYEGDQTVRVGLYQLLNEGSFGDHLAVDAAVEVPGVGILEGCREEFLGEVLVGDWP